MPPAPRLDACHGNGQVRLRGHQNRQIDDAVLLGADKLFAIEHENGFIAPVEHVQFGNPPSLGNFGDLEIAACESFVQRDVRRSPRRNTGNQGNDRQSVEGSFRADKYVSQRSSNRIRQVSLAAVFGLGTQHLLFNSTVSGGYDRTGHGGATPRHHAAVALFVKDRQRCRSRSER